MRRQSWLVILAVVGGGFLGTAHAAPKPSAKDLQDAKAHFLAGASYYSNGVYEDAAKEFKQSYELSKKPEILYNIAQCYGKIGDDPTTVSYLRRYLQEKPTADDRNAVEAWIRNLDQKIAAAARTAPPDKGTPPDTGTPPDKGTVPDKGTLPPDGTIPDKGGTPPDKTVVIPSGGTVGTGPDKGADVTPPGGGDALPPAPVTHKIRVHGSKTMQWIGIATAGVGAVMLGVGIFEGVKAKQDSDNLEAYLLPPPKGTYGIYDKGAIALEKSGKDHMSLQKTFTGLGVVAVLGGGVIWYLGYRTHSETVTEKSTYVTGMLAPDGAGAMVGGRF